ncbi:cobyrinic acid a,c-diamide synthase [Thalassospira sp. HJ]|uniref:ParA family protein n=1 Tax=Thalassospira sp. HJ TaxID=1616823 RepID=UPI0005CE8309|nr:AAA family ATPase [Thalassospira sp. HJ]KJE36378.1 cobyrinic acid a,c-diamide synthase [Thalassospira sp. HJ]
MKVVSVINYKGGVGKTSLTANLAAELAFRGKRILVMDLDAQASLTFSFIKPDEWQNSFASSKTIKTWFDESDGGAQISLKDLCHKPERVNSALPHDSTLDIIPSHLGLINVDLELATRLGGANLSQSKKNFISVHRMLADGLDDIRATGLYDIVLIDCPPNFNIVTKTAIIASDYILVPTRPDELSTLGIDYLMRSIGELLKDYNDYVKVVSNDSKDFDEISPIVVGVVFTMVQEYAGEPMSAQKTYIKKLQTESDLAIFDSYIKRNDTVFAESPVYGVPVVLNSYSNVSHQSVVDGLEAVATEFLEKLGE